MLEHNNLEEYNDPISYDLEFGGETRKYSFYIEQAKKCKGPVMELACGTGLTALPIAGHGIPVTGVDLSLSMLEYAKVKAKYLPIEFFVDDACTFRMDKRFSMIYLTGNSFQSFLTKEAQKALLETVKAHLEPEGILVFETRNPSGTDLSLQEKEVPWGTFKNADRDVVTVSGTQCYDAEKQIMHWKTIRRWDDQETAARIACRFTDSEELAALLDENGFAIKEQYGDWDKSPLLESSPFIITICSLK